MWRGITTTIAAVICGAALCGCAVTCRQTPLTVVIGSSVHYRSAGGDRFEARYGSLSDGSLNFVKVWMPDGQEYTLPQALSASGVRYTDDRELTWWEHHGTVDVEVMDAQGNWKPKYSGLRAATENH